MSEYVKLWRNEEYKEIELLSASFKDFSFSKHWHDELSIGLIQKGVETVDYRGSKIDIPQGNIIAINPSEIHTGFSGSSEGWTYRMFYFNLTLVQEILSSHFKHSSVILKEPIIYDPSLFKKLLKLHFSLEEKEFTLTKDSELIIAITELFTHHGDIKQKETLEYKDFKVNTLVKDYLIDNYNDNISLDELSKLAQRDKYQVIRNFKNQFNLTPHQFLVLLKTKKAKQLLELGLDITNAALDCGFCDQSHFTKNFKNLYGTTPGQYLSYAK